MKLAGPESRKRPSPHRDLVLAAATLGFGVIQLDVSVVNVAVKPIGAALGSVDRSWSGVVSGTLTAFRQTGSVLGVVLFGSLLAGMGAAAGLHTACAIAVGLVLVVAALILASEERRNGKVS
jgi:hypothetical protein